VNAKFTRYNAHAREVLTVEIHENLSKGLERCVYKKSLWPLGKTALKIN
jgi:hypothetical protein